jgi:hypothetical protein
VSVLFGFACLTISLVLLTLAVNAWRRAWADWEQAWDEVER